MKLIKVKPPRSKLPPWEAMALATRNLADDVYLRAKTSKIRKALIVKKQK